jgi:hypothetical protein
VASKRAQEVTTPLLWQKGGQAEIVKLEGDAIVLRSTTSAPPGARLEATFDGVAVKIKSHGSHKEEDGSFTLKGRLLDATRDLRTKLAGSLRPAEEDA